MRTSVNLSAYYSMTAKYFSQKKIFHEEVIEKSKTNLLCPTDLYCKSYSSTNKQESLHYMFISRFVNSTINDGISNTRM